MADMTLVIINETVLCFLFVILLPHCRLSKIWCQYSPAVADIASLCDLITSYIHPLGLFVLSCPRTHVVTLQSRGRLSGVL